MSSKRSKKIKHTRGTNSKLSLTTQNTTHKDMKINTKWLNNIIQGKGLIEIAIRKQKWTQLINLIKNNKNDWINIINTPNNSVLFYLFKAQKYKLVWNLNKQYPFQWSINDLTYLILYHPQICSHDYKSSVINKHQKGKYYVSLYKIITNTLNTLNKPIIWEQYILNEYNNQNETYIHPKIEYPLLGYALLSSNIYVINNLINNNEYKIGQSIKYLGKNVNYIVYFLSHIIENYTPENKVNHIIANKTIYISFIKKIFKRQNINWNFQIQVSNTTYNLLTYLYHIHLKQINEYNEILYIICQETLKHIDPNKPDPSGNYPLDLHINDNLKPYYGLYPYVKLLIDNGDFKYNLYKSYKDNDDIIKKNIQLVIENYDNFHNNLISNYKNIIKYIKNNNVIETLIKSRFSDKEREQLYSIINLNKNQNISNWLLNIHDNINVITSISNYLTHSLLPNNKLLSIEDYNNIKLSDKKVLTNILSFISSINGLEHIENFDIKDTNMLNNIFIYNTHPFIYNFPVIYKISKQIMSQYPKNSYVITVGESLDKILFLQQLIQKDDKKYNNTYIGLPFSGNINFDNKQEVKLTDKYCKYLYKKNIHPEQIINNNQKIVIIDFVASGRGIYSFIHMYFKLCTQNWSSFKLNKLTKLTKIIILSSWEHTLKNQMKNINLPLYDIKLPYGVLSYLYDIDDYRCMKQFKTDNWNQLNDVNFNEKQQYNIGQQINGCNLLRFYIVDKYINYTKQSKSINKSKSIKKT